MRIFSSGLVMAWNRGGLSCIILLGDSSLTRTLLDVDRLVVQLNQKPWGIAEKWTKGSGGQGPEYPNNFNIIEYY